VRQPSRPPSPKPAEERARPAWAASIHAPPAMALAGDREGSRSLATALTQATNRATAVLGLLRILQAPPRYALAGDGGVGLEAPRPPCPSRQRQPPTWAASILLHPGLPLCSFSALSFASQPNRYVICYQVNARSEVIDSMGAISATSPAGGNGYGFHE